MIYLITGTAGFIGFHTAKRLLENGINVVGIDNLNSYSDVILKKKRNELLKKYQNYRFHQIDISSSSEVQNIFKKYKFDKICHLAAQAGIRYSLINPQIYEQSNIKGFFNILECAKDFQVRDIVFASSSSVYGDSNLPKKGFNEKQKALHQVSFYGLTKKTNELMAYTYHKLYRMNLTGLRFFTVYGPWGRPDMAYFKFTEKILAHKPIDVYNKGKMWRDFTYIDDIVDGIISALNKPFGYEIFNLGNSQAVQIMTLIKLLEKELGKKAILNYRGMQQGDIKNTFADISKAKKRLDFYPKTSIEEGIGEFIKWVLLCKRNNDCSNCH